MAQHKSTTTTADTVLNAEEFARNAERITNTAATAEGLKVYAPDALAEWITDGVYERYEGIATIRPAVIALYDLWRARGLRIHKEPQCADANHIVLTYTGGFAGGTKIFGTEIWTFRDGLVVHHQMYSYLDVRPRTSVWAQARIFFIDPRTALRAKRIERRHARQSV